MKRAQVVTSVASVLVASGVFVPARPASPPSVGASPAGEAVALEAYITTDFGAVDGATTVDVQIDGKLVVGGFTGDDILDSDAPHSFAIARYLPDGRLDDTFGTAGKVVSEFSAQHQVIWDLALQPDGKVVVAGEVRDDRTDDRDLIVARYLTDGRLDAGFGTGGYVRTDIDGRSSDDAEALALQDDGYIVVLGNSTARGTWRTSMRVVRYTESGELDAAFGLNGKTVVTVPGDARGADIALQDDGAIVVVGKARTLVSSMWNLVAARLDRLGSPDGSFGTNGVASVPIGPLYARSINVEGSAVEVLGDGRILAAGTGNPETGRGHDFVLVRLAADGTMDQSFGVGGHVATDLGNMKSESLEDVAVLSDGRLLSAGCAFPLPVSLPALALTSHLADGTVDAEFGSAAPGSAQLYPGGSDTGLWVHALTLVGPLRAAVVGWHVDYGAQPPTQDFGVALLGLPASSVPTPTRAASPTGTAASTLTPTPTAPATGPATPATATATVPPLAVRIYLPHAEREAGP